MVPAIVGWPGKAVDWMTVGVVVGANLAVQGSAWLFMVNRQLILGYTERNFRQCYEQLDGGDKRIMRAFLDPESLSNTYSLIGGKPGPRAGSEFGLSFPEIGRFVLDAFGPEATFDNSFVERDEGADKGRERWFFVNGIATSRDLARYNVKSLREMFKRPFTLIHNPTQGLTHDLVEAALQKFTNINTEPVARAFLEISNALLDDSAHEVVVIAHSQGTIIMGDVLDLIYCSIDRRFFDRTNMNDEDFDEYMTKSSGTVKSGELNEVREKLEAKGPEILKKMQLYMLANAASRMCYADEKQKIPHIESYANHHDIVTRLGSLARDDFHKEDLIRIDGDLFTNARYGHLLNAHYLPDFIAGKYTRNTARAGVCIDSSIHDPVQGNPCQKHPKHQPGPGKSKLRELYLKAQSGANIGGAPKGPQPEA